jgi:nucleotide-binding universal stress UspA family protein
MAALKPEIKKILVPIDGSDTSFRTAKYALALAKDWNASVMLLHVSQIPPFPAYLKSLDKHYKEVRQHAEEWFDKIKNYQEGAGVDIRTKVVTAALSIIGTIAETAQSENIDLIVMGPRGISKFSKLLLGSVTSGVTTYAPCSVLVVK